MFLDKLPLKVILLQAGTTISHHTLAAWTKSLSKIEGMQLSVSKVTDKLSEEPSVYIIDLSHNEGEVKVLEQVAKFSDKNHRLIVIANGNTHYVMSEVNRLQRKKVLPIGKNCHVAHYPKKGKDFVIWLEEILLNKPRPTPNFLRVAHL